MVSDLVHVKGLATAKLAMNSSHKDAAMWQEADSLERVPSHPYKSDFMNSVSHLVIFGVASLEPIRISQMTIARSLPLPLEPHLMSHTDSHISEKLLPFPCTIDL